VSRIVPLLLLGPALAAQAPLGTWTLEKAPDIEAAIETAVKEASFIVRPIARGRLRKTNPAYKRVKVERAGESFSVTYDERAPQVMPASGVPVKWKREDGDVFDISMRPQGADLLQTYKAEDGQRTNVFHVDPATGRLSLTVTVTSTKLPKPVVYTLTYASAH